MKWLGEVDTFPFGNVNNDEGLFLFGDCYYLMNEWETVRIPPGFGPTIRDLIKYKESTTALQVMFDDKLEDWVSRGEAYTKLPLHGRVKSGVESIRPQAVCDCSECAGLRDEVWGEPVELMYEDALLKSMTDKEYSKWHDESFVTDGVRMGPKVESKPLPFLCVCGRPDDHFGPCRRPDWVEPDDIRSGRIKRPWFGC